MEGRVQIDRFAVRNFRSIRESDVELSPLTFFIGANASGKTSFVDAMLFVAAALRNSPAKAIADRGGIHSILNQPVRTGARMRFAFYLSSSSGECEFNLEMGIRSGWSTFITREECRIVEQGARHYYLVENGTVEGSASLFPRVNSDRIFLADASGLPEFRPLFDYLANLGSTQPTLPHVHRTEQYLNRMVRRVDPTAKETGIAVRFRNLSSRHPDRLEIVQQYLRAIAPPFDRITVIELDDSLWLQFIEKSPSGDSTPFYLSQASAGLVNAAEILLELFEIPEAGKPVSPVIIEEPEALLHPGAIQVIRDSFIEASRTRQILVTTHSPDLLDDPSVPPEWIRAVYRDDEGTHVDVLDAATKSVIHDHLYTPGQLLRQGGLILRS